MQLIQDYQESWKENFNQIKEVLVDVLFGLDVTVEHVGSTAVPGLAAKPIIDIDIACAKNVKFDIVRKRLSTIGYEHKGDFSIPNREVFKRNTKQEKHPVLDMIAHHLYVCPYGSLELKRHLLFRNFLIDNADARITYQEIKLQIAKEANQIHAVYAEFKEDAASDFINGILDKL